MTNRPNFLQRVRSLPENQRLAIFFAAMGIVVIITGLYVVQSTQRNIARLSQSMAAIQIPTLVSPNTTTPSNNTPTSAAVASGNVENQNTASQGTSALPSDISVWPVYNNARYSFQVRYPAYAVAQAKISANPDVTTWMSFAKIETNPAAPSASLNIEVLHSPLSPQEWATTNFKDGALVIKPGDMQATDFNGTPAIQFVIAGTTANYAYTIFRLDSQNLAMLFYREPHNADPTSYLPNSYQSFLSTFTIIPPTTNK